MRREGELPVALSAVLRPLPLFPLQPALAALLARLVRRHAAAFERLGAYRGKTFGIDPTDLPFAFVMRLDPVVPRLRAVRSMTVENVDALIAGPLLKLIQLVDGQADGDALFFARDLTIEGDVEAVLALRNAIDDSELRLIGDLVAFAGPLGRPLLRAGSEAMAMLGRLGGAIRPHAR